MRTVTNSLAGWKPSRITSREGTKKVTLYFTQDTIAALHQKWVQRLAEEPNVTKSAIVEEPLRTRLGL